MKKIFEKCGPLVKNSYYRPVFSTIKPSPNHHSIYTYSMQTSRENTTKPTSNLFKLAKQKQNVSIRTPQEPSEPSISDPVVETQSNPVRKRRKRRRLFSHADKKLLTMTPSAVSRVNFLMSNQNDPNIVGLSIGVTRRGCNGLTYKMDYVYKNQFESDPDLSSPMGTVFLKSLDQPNKPSLPHEHVIEHSIHLFVNREALFFILGSEMDFIENEVEAKFDWINPNAKSRCGCGESFTIDDD
mmetsp:Transcript_6193/g.9005  ORF Transcript_6193/g.9005 Transcript_6193/m.9005 type:complete len:241 (+) Transcript_6193:55-777(+)